MSRTQSVLNNGPPEKTRPAGPGFEVRIDKGVGQPGGSTADRPCSQVLWTGYRRGQNATWIAWMGMVCTLSTTRPEWTACLGEALDATARSAEILRPRILPVSAVGTRASGMTGFGVTHRQALDARRLVQRLTPSARFTSYEDMKVVVLAGVATLDG